MKKFYFLLLGLFLCSGVNAQIINFPDANFKAKLLEASPSNFIATDLSGNFFKLDANNDGEIEVSEALQVNFLDVSNSSLSSINGISNFSNLRQFVCIITSLTSADLSSLTKLLDINVQANQLTSLNVDGLTGVYSLMCDGNQLTSLNVSSLVNLQQLNCSGNQLSSLALTGLSKLTNFYCDDNQITSLDLSNMPILEYFGCSTNQISTLNVSNLPNLLQLQCGNNPLFSIDASSLTKLDILNADNTSSLITIFMKNGSNETNVNFVNCSNLLYICADDTQLNDIQSKIVTYGYTICNVNSYCSFVPGGIFYTIQGNNRFDSDNNGCNVSDIAVANLKLNIASATGSGSTISNETGAYSIPVLAGTHTVTPALENPSYFNVSPTNAIVDFPTQTSPFTQDFCITANGVHPDLEVTLLPISPARPGFEANYKIIYKNKGTTTQSGSVNLTFVDAVLDFVSATPATTSQATNNLSWDFTNLLPFETREITLTLKVNAPTDTAAVNNGDILDFTAAITSPATDETPTDNTIAFHQTVVGSYDPNDKTCLEGTTIAPEMVGEYVHYVIRFENTGTFPAQNIVVKDMIDLAKFDINTLIPIKGSHEFVTNITSGNKVEFIFENINLPFEDANNDGFVAFEIKTKSSLVVGDTFTNSANIYFDYNFPIVTDPATTTVQTLGKSDFEFAEYFTVYPNPASSTLNLTAKSGITVNSIGIYNTLGQLVIAVPNTQSVSSFDVSSLKTGNYFIKMVTDKGSSNMKFMKN